MGRLIISESEKTDILRQYNLILEEDDEREPLVIDKVITFPAGYHSEKYLKDLVPEVEKITQYLKSGKGNAFLVGVEMSSGESQIPNSDVETKNPEGTTQGWLAQQRQTSITKYITDQLQGFVEQKLLLSLPTFTINPIAIGQTPWVGQTFIQPNGEKYVCTEKEKLAGCITKYRACRASTCKDLASKYASEQYIKVKITLKELSEQKKCLDNMTIEVNYTKDSFTISAMCWNPLGYSFPNWGYGCHEGVGTIIVTNGTGEKFTYESATPRERDETKTLVTINACGSGKK
jgi:hypothetical protein